MLEDYAPSVLLYVILELNLLVQIKLTNMYQRYIVAPIYGHNAAEVLDTNEDRIMVDTFGVLAFFGAQDGCPCSPPPPSVGPD
jgi:hypothetical protein